MKKVISLVLAAVALLTFAAIPTFAAGEAEKTDIDFITSFGFVKPADGEQIAADTALTRIELAEIFYNIIFPTQNIESNYWGNADYPDVPAEKKHIVSAVYGMGVMRGYSDTVFAPNDPVTYIQAVKAMVSFLGYDLQAQMMGGYPSGYLSQATRLQILPGGNIAGDTVATYGCIALMLKKAIGVDIAIWNNTSADGTGVQDIQEGVDYLKYYRGVSLTKGIITGNYLTNIRGGSATNYFGIYINGHQMEVAESAHGLQDMLGYDTYIYYTEENGYKTAIYFEEGINNVLEVSSGNIASVTEGRISYYLPGETDVYVADFAQNAHLIYNGTYEAAFTVADLNPFESKKLDGFIRLIDNNNDGIFDNIVVRAYKSIVVNEVRNNKIYGMYDVSGNPNDKVVDLTHYKERNINIRNVMGGTVDITSIKKGSVVDVCSDKNGVVKEIIAAKDSMTGVIEEISYAGNKISSVKIAGILLMASNGIIVMDSANKLAPGLVADVFFNSEAQIALIDVESNYTEGYRAGYLVDAGTEGGLEKSAICLIFDSEGVMKTYNLADRVSVNGLPVDDVDAIDKFGKTDNRVKRQVIFYKTDLDEKIVTAVQTATQISSDDQAFNGFYQYPGESFYYKGGFKSFNDTYIANDNTVVFGVPSEENRDKYDNYTIAQLPTGETGLIGSESAPADITLYGTGEDAVVVNMAVINASSSSGGDTTRRPVFIVTKVSTAIDNEGESGLKISGMYVEGSQLLTGGFFIDESLFTSGHDLGIDSDLNNGKRPFIDQNETLPSPGDVFRVPSFAATGRIKQMDVTQFYQLYDYSDDKFLSTSVHQDGNESCYHVMGTVVFKDATTIKIRLDNGTYKSFELSAGRYSFAEITKSKQTGEVTATASTADSILSEKTHPGEASRVLIHYRGIGIACYIFNDK